MKKSEILDLVIGVAVVLTGGVLLISLIVAVVNHFS